MAAWLEELRARKDKSPGRIEFDLPGGERLSIPLRYPTGEAKAGILEFIDKEKQVKNKKKRMSENIKDMEILQRMTVRACIVGGDEATDEEIDILICESGGMNSELVIRSSRLLGLGMSFGAGGAESAGR